MIESTQELIAKNVEHICATRGNDMVVEVIPRKDLGLLYTPIAITFDASTGEVIDPVGRMAREWHSGELCDAEVRIYVDNLMAKETKAINVTWGHPLNRQPEISLEVTKIILDTFEQYLKKVNITAP